MAVTFLLRSRRWMIAAGLLLLAMLVTAWFLPAVVARTGKGALVAAVLPEFRGEATLGRVSLGWLSPVRIRDVAFRDEAGEPLAEAVELATEAPLWRLVWGSQNIGVIHLHEPTFHVIVRDGGSNLEDAIAPLLEGPSSGMTYALHVADGKLVVRERDSDRQAVIERVSAELTVPAGADDPIAWRIAGRVIESGAGGSAAIEGEWRTAGDGWGDGRMHLETTGLSLAALVPLLTRCGIEADLAGRGDARGEIRWGDDGRLDVEFERLNLQQLSAQAPQYLGSDTLELAEFTASGGAAMADGTLTLRDAAAACDIGRLQATGQLKWDDLSADRFASVIRSSHLHLDGEADLARLARVFPQTLRLRKGLTITSGKVRAVCTTRDEDGARRWEGRLETSDLAAVHLARRVSWEQPLSAAFAVRDSAGGPVIEQASCRADFLQADGRGSLRDGSISLQGDLSKLSAELEKFVDLGEMRFGGSLEGDVQWRRGEGGETEASGDVRLSQFEWSAPGRRPWREPQLAATITAAGLLDDGGVRRIDRGRLELKAAGDSAAVQLRGPVEQPGRSADWPVQCEISGDLASWLPRAENFVSLSAWTLEGGFSASAAGIVSADRVQLDEAHLAVNQLRLAGAGMTIIEPRVEAKSDLVWDGQQRSLAVTHATLTSSSVALRAQNVAATFQPGAFSASGEIDFRGDLARVAPWFAKPQSRPARNVEGVFAGRMLARHTAGGVEVQGSADVENLAYSVPAGASAPPGAGQPIAWSTMWREPRLRIAGEAAYSPQSDSLSLKQLSAAGDALRLSANGDVADLSQTCRVNLSGQHDMDLEKLALLLRPLIGADFRMSGRAPRPFTIQGPLLAAAGAAPVFVSPDLTAETSLAWSSASYQGIQAGAGEAPIVLVGGVATLGPLDLPVSEGRLTAAPAILLNESPMAATLAAGPLLQNVRISPAMCRSWLKYVAPLLADAAQAEGRFSVELTQPARIPLDAPSRAEARGVLNVHGAQIGPGPLSQPFLVLADQVKAAVERRPFAPGQAGGATWLNVGQQSIAFEIVKGRVYHRDFQVTAGDVVIRTRGSVGVDQSLDLLAEVPIHDGWVDREPLLSGFRGQALHVPVSGTLSSPRLDRRASEQFARQMVGDAARRLLEENLNLNPDVRGALDKLFRRSP